MTSVNVLEYFSTATDRLKFGGGWKPDKDASYSQKALRWIYNGSVFGLPFFFSFLEGVELFYGNNDFNNSAKNLNMFIQLMSLNVKVFMWFGNFDKTFNVISRLRGELAFDKTEGDFRPDDILRDELKFKKKIDLSFVLTALGTPISACVYAIFLLLTQSDKYTSQFVNSNNGTETIYTQPLPYVSFIPWNYKNSKLKFAAAAVLQCWSVFVYANLAIGLDIMFTSTVAYVNALLKVLAEAFRTIKERSVQRLQTRSSSQKHLNSINEEMNKEMDKCIQGLQVIYEESTVLEAVFTYQVLLQVLVSLICLCTSLYLTATNLENIGRVVVEAIYIGALMSQIFLYCYFGNEATLVSESLSFSVYDIDWFETPKSFKTKMIITVARLRRPIYFTIGKFTPLTLPTCVWIYRAAYSYFAILRNHPD